VTSVQPAQPANPRVLGFDEQHVPISGYVAALNRETGELLWQRPINEPATDPTAFDVSQPAGWPVLLFAGRMFVNPPPGAVVPGFAANQGQRLTVTLIDKETGEPIYSREETSNV